jgi:hypothetical protein
MLNICEKLMVLLAPADIEEGDEQVRMDALRIGQYKDSQTVENWLNTYFTLFTWDLKIGELCFLICALSHLYSCCYFGNGYILGYVLC